MADRDFGTEHHRTITRLRETVVALRRIREEFGVEIRDLADAGTRDRPPSPSKALTVTSRERSYERLLRLRRIHAKLETRERLLQEVSGSSASTAPQRGTAASSD
ncbi:MAG TPA: hypothetical protein DEP35_20185 [Deltaproteobacteria bacterium]|jgi:hypothetical protein|nr:hypothetical protein [Deltaproteobacteria bacterium]